MTQQFPVLALVLFLLRKKCRVARWRNNKIFETFVKLENFNRVRQSHNSQSVFLSVSLFVSLFVCLFVRVCFCVFVCFSFLSLSLSLSLSLGVYPENRHVSLKLVQRLMMLYWKVWPAALKLPSVLL